MGNTFTIPARYDQIASLCDKVVDEAIAAGLDNDAVFQVQLACDEACTNVIEHAYGEQKGKIEVKCLIEGAYFVVTIRDYGRAFDPSAVSKPAAASGELVDLEKLEVGGLGLHFMHRLMDEVKFRFDAHHGNLLTMKKRLPR